MWELTFWKMLLLLQVYLSDTVTSGAFILPFRVFIIDLSELISLYLQKVSFFRDRTYEIYFSYNQFLSIYENSDSLFKRLLD
jgi:hypothetical protein